MPLMDALKAGIGLSNDSNLAVINAAKARYAYPMTEQELLQKIIDNRYRPETYRLGNKKTEEEILRAQLERKYLPTRLQLENQKLGLENKYYGGLAESKIDEANLYRRNPLLKLSGPAGQIGALIFLEELKKQRGENSPPLAQGEGSGLAQGGNYAPPPLSQNSGQQMPSQGGIGLAQAPPMMQAPGGAPLRRPSSGLQAPMQGMDYSKILTTQLNALDRLRNTRADLDQERIKNFNWAQLPAQTRNNIVAQGLGMGVDPIKMKDYIASGATLQEIAQKEGLDPNNIPPPVYYPTETTKTRVQLVNQVGAELDYLSSATTPIIERYASTIAGFSGKRISDMLSGDPEAQKRFGEYIGALSVQSGLANGRVALEGGRAGVEVMKIIKDSALQGIDQHSPIKMSPLAFKTAQKTIDRILQKGAKIRTMTGMSPLAEFSNKKEKSEKDPLELFGSSGEDNDEDLEDPLGLGL